MSDDVAAPLCGGERVALDESLGRLLPEIMLVMPSGSTAFLGSVVVCASSSPCGFL